MRLLLTTVDGQPPIKHALQSELMGLVSDNGFHRSCTPFHPPHLRARRSHLLHYRTGEYREMDAKVLILRVAL